MTAPVTAPVTAEDNRDRLASLPVELRDMDFALVSRATVGTAAEKLAEVSDPSVYLSVTLPDGAKVGREVDCGAAGPKDATAVEALLAQLPSVSAFLNAQQAVDAPDARTMLRDGVSYAPLAGGSGGVMAATVFVGTGVAARDPAPLDLADADGVAIARDRHAKPALVQLFLPDWMPVNLLLPKGATVELRGDGEGWFRTTIVTGICAIDDLLRLRATGRVEDVASILKGLSSADAVEWFDTHPAAAAVLGYGLLRTEQPDTLWGPFATIRERWPDDPDALVIAAEVAARVGLHDEAAETFLAAARIGLPTYSFGLNYLVDRLRAYGPRPGGPEFAAGQARAITQALKQVHSFALQQDYDMMLTCYSGADPTRPEADPADA